MSSDRVVLGVDIGTKCGWAVIDSSGVVDSGVVNFRPNSKVTPGGRLVHAGKLFDSLVWRNHMGHGSVHTVYFEQVRRFMSSDAAYTFCGIMGQLLVACEKNGVPVIGLSPTEIKKFATGSGKAKKPDMIAAAAARFGIVPIDDNHADALLIAAMGAQDV